jgi:hypothetical protein
MSRNNKQADSPVSTLKNEAARQRWELFHLAISHAKKSNIVAMQEAETPAAEPERSGPLLSIAR